MHVRNTGSPSRVRSTVTEMTDRTRTRENGPEKKATGGQQGKEQINLVVEDVTRIVPHVATAWHQSTCLFEKLLNEKFHRNVTRKCWEKLTFTDTMIFRYLELVNLHW